MIMVRTSAAISFGRRMPKYSGVAGRGFEEGGLILMTVDGYNFTIRSSPYEKRL